MKSTAHIEGHPIHPMLIPFPFALLSAAAAFDVAARVTRRSAYSQTAGHLRTAGLGSALVAAVPGIVDYFGTVPQGTQARQSATRHALSNLSALACFAAASARRKNAGIMPASALALELAGAGLLSVGGWLGGNLVYHHRIGIDDGTAPREVRPPRVLRSSAPKRVVEVQVPG